MGRQAWRFAPPWAHWSVSSDVLEIDAKRKPKSPILRDRRRRCAFAGERARRRCRSARGDFPAWLGPLPIPRRGSCGPEAAASQQISLKWVVAPCMKIPRSFGAVPSKRGVAEFPPWHVAPIVRGPATSDRRTTERRLGLGGMTFRVAGFEVTRRRVASLVLVAAGLITLSLLYRRIDVAHLHELAQRLPGALVFCALTLLPLVGFPVSVLHAVMGVRFGLVLALPLVAASIFLQLLLSYGLVRLAPGFFARRLEPLRRRLPRAAHWPLTWFTLLLPGAPFFAQNYVLPLMGVPLRIFLSVALPLHLLRSVIGVTFGELSDRLTPWTVAGFASYGVAVMLACGWAFRRLRARLRDPQPEEDGPRLPE